MVLGSVMVVLGVSGVLMKKWGSFIMVIFVVNWVRWLSDWVIEMKWLGGCWLVGEVLVIVVGVVYGGVVFVLEGVVWCYDGCGILVECVLVCGVDVVVI